MKLRILLATMLALGASSLFAQLRYGFKTGLNFAHLEGPAETGPDGAELESWKNVTGFHIGLAMGYNFTDNFGMRGELLFSKKGGKYTFDGPSYRIFRYDGGSTFATGNSKYLINLSTSYIDLPVMGFARWKDFEFSAGAYVGLMTGAIGSGSLTFSNGVTDAPLNNPVDKIQFNLDYNYRRDNPGEGDAATTVVAQVDGRTLELPKTLGAYYDYPEDRGNLYKSFDYGLIGGVSYFFSRSLYFGVRFQYGLADVTNGDADLARANTGRVSSSSLEYRGSDKDRNVVVQASVGFSF